MYLAGALLQVQGGRVSGAALRRGVSGLRLGTIGKANERHRAAQQWRRQKGGNPNIAQTLVPYTLRGQKRAGAIFATLTIAIPLSNCSNLLDPTLIAYKDKKTNSCFYLPLPYEIYVTQGNGNTDGRENLENRQFRGAGSRHAKIPKEEQGATLPAGLCSDTEVFQVVAGRLLYNQEALVQQNAFR